MSLKFVVRSLAMTSVLACACLLAACQDKGGGQAGGGQARAPQVSVEKVEPSSQIVVNTLQGRTAPFMVAEVRPQVTGILQKRLFEEGSDVKEGQPLYQIDPALYQASVDSAKAELERAKSVLYQAELTANRYSKLVKTQAVSQQQNDDAQAAKRQGLAAVAAAEAQLKNAQINLDYTTIRSPINGKVGRSLVTPGALLTAHQAQNMAVVQRLDPIYVDVTQSSRDLLRIKKEIASGHLKMNDGKIPVDLIMEDGQQYHHQGQLTLSEVSVDQGTGSITLRAEFPNPEQLLLPGMFVRTKLPEGTRENAILVPQKAVMRSPTGEPYVFLVKDGKAVQTPIQTERTVGLNWLVQSGLEPGDEVVIEGFQRIRDGVPVQIVPTLEEQAKQQQAKQAQETSKK